MIKGIVFRWKQIRFIRGTFRNVSRYLDSGSYCLLDNMRSLVNKRDRQLYSQYFRQTTNDAALGLMVKILNVFNLFGVKGDSTDKQGSYGALYIANNNDRVRELKLLNVNNGTVMVLFTSVQAKNDYVKLYNRLNGLYNMPKIRNNEVDRDNALVISLIRKMEGICDREAIKNICNSHIRQLEDIDCKCSNSNYYCELRSCTNNINSKAKNLIDRLHNCISQEVLQEEYLSCLQHGDLSADNLMYGEVDNSVDYWWIDWEHVGMRVFFYDVFFYILNNAVADGNYIPTKNFLAGHYDEDLDRLFTAAGYKYSEKSRKEYFLRFSIEFIKERLREERLMGAVDQYQIYYDKYFR